MGTSKSLEDIEINILIAMTGDVQTSHGIVLLDARQLKNTVAKLRSRYRSEGISFLTKTLPRLGKALDKALAATAPLNSVSLGFKPYPDCKYPKLFGELFSRVLRPDGYLLDAPCAKCVGILRDLLYLFYKYELPYDEDQEHEVLSRFEKTEADLVTLEPVLQTLENQCGHFLATGASRFPKESDVRLVILSRAKAALSRLFLGFDPLNIVPRHGPGVVSTKETHEAKFGFTNVGRSITDVYPLDAYFYASPGHVCDRLSELQTTTETVNHARVILVPKDSRGPRLISCEPVDFQWIQQGLGRAIVAHVERHPLTRYNVHFTDQTPNRIAALHGSRCLRYSTLDLNEASDRVSLQLVQSLFPSELLPYLLGCRTTSTVLPDGRILNLKKFAPMGSSLCFPILALTTWAILHAAAPNEYTRERILVYGDDVIVPTAFAVNAIEQLESFGLKVNRDKSCTGGLFRESCGMDAFNGVQVTPVRIRTVWSSSRSPSAYVSWVSYADSLYKKHYIGAYEFIVGRLFSLYGTNIPSEEHVGKTAPSLPYIPEGHSPPRRRWNRHLQRYQYRVFVVDSKKIHRDMDGWKKLLRYFSEHSQPTSDQQDPTDTHRPPIESLFETAQKAAGSGFSASQYTRRNASILVMRWR